MTTPNTTLHITHRIDGDFDAWLATFRTFDDVRARGGVTATRVRHGVEDPKLVDVELDFDDAEHARAFLGFLESEVWPTSPHLDGTPATSLLVAVG